MKITDIVTYVLKAKLEKPLLWANGGISERSLLLVEVITDEGVSGWGECHLAVETVKIFIDSILKPLILGKDPLDFEQNWALMFNSTIRFGQKGIAICAIGALDVALWDVAGKSLKLPLYKMLGGRRFDKVIPYATGFYFKEKNDFSAEFANEAVQYMEQGFKAMKMKVGLGIKKDMRNVKAVRQAVGYDILLMVDATWAYDVHSAMLLGRKLEEEGVYWFEEPLPPVQLDGYVELAKNLEIAIAGIESEFTAFNFKRIIDSRAVDILQPDLVTSGGITECRRIAAMANISGIPCVLHVWSSAIALAASLHFTSAQRPLTPSLYEQPPLFEYDRMENPFRDNITIGSIEYRNGFLWVPDCPGIGVEIDRKALSYYQVF